ncbi:MAG: F420-nonreducing hydrogenase [Thermoproteota archaeon]
MVRLATVGLMACSGCHISLTALSDRLFEVLKNIELVHSYILMDSKQIPENIDIGIVEGGLRTSHDEEVLRELRRKSKVLVAVGDCACFGGTPGLANLYNLEDSFKAAYIDNPSTVLGFKPDKDLPETRPQALPISEIVKVDYMVPGCPPRETTLENVLIPLLSGKSMVLSSKSVCDECPRRRTGKKPEKIKRLHEGTIDTDKCLLEQGYICMGPVTRAGCEASCIRAGAVCDGCYGPSEKTWDQGLTMLDGLIGMAGEKLPRLKIETLAGLLYRYTFASSILRKMAERPKAKASEE